MRASITYYWNKGRRSYGSSYQTILVRAFALFNSRSKWVSSGAVGSMSPATEEAFQQYYLDFLNGTAIDYCTTRELPNATHWCEPDWGVEMRRDSENIDTMRRSTAFIAAATLSLDPKHAGTVLPDGRSVSEHHTRWEAWYYAWTRWFATHGLFEELGSSYWPRTWGCVFNLLDLPPSARVRARARMLVDIAMVEAEQGSQNGFRVGQKSRAKRDTSREALPFTMYVNLSPQFYGKNLSEAPQPFDRIINQEAGSYEMSNVSILMHLFGAAPDTGGVYTVKNRMVGEQDAEHFGFCPPKSSSALLQEKFCNDTGRTSPCQCAHNTQGIIAQPPYNDPVPFRANSRQVSYIHFTPSFSMSGVLFSPNHFFAGGSQQRWTGLVFSNANSTTLGLRHLTGEKWALVDQGVMIAQKCASCNYGGEPSVDLFQTSGYWQQGDWTFVAANGTLEGDAYAAVRPAWGGASLTEVKNPRNPPIFSLVPHDPWAPLIIIAGRATDFASGEAFAKEVLAAPLSVHQDSWQRKTVALEWRGKRLEFYPNTVLGQFRLPTINAVPVNDQPDKVYDGPHLEATMGSSLVTARYKDYVIEYDFATDEIRRASE